jgi:CheY-like chemotaxis protein
MTEKRPLILAIDTNEASLDNLKQILSNEGYNIEGASGTAEGIKKYNQICPDFVMTALNMEEIDSGLKIIKKIRELGNKAPAFLLTSPGDEVCDNTTCENLGIAGMIDKPFDRDNVIKLVKAKL